jgi:hypothetical protein
MADFCIPAPAGRADIALFYYKSAGNARAESREQAGASFNM